MDVIDKIIKDIEEETGEFWKGDDAFRASAEIMVNKWGIKPVKVVDFLCELRLAVASEYRD